jgi:hypothetical protein
MADLARASKSRAKEIEARTGVVVKVAYQVAGLPLASFGGAHGVVSLAFQLNAVDLYATRQDGGSPNIHFACQRAPTSSRFPVVVTLPGCIVVRAGRAGYRLLTLPERAPTTVDEVVLHAFALLFGTAESVRQARTPLPLPPSP